MTAAVDIESATGTRNAGAGVSLIAVTRACGPGGEDGSERW